MHDFYWSEKITPKSGLYGYKETVKKQKIVFFFSEVNLKLII